MISFSTWNQTPPHSPLLKKQKKEPNAHELLLPSDIAVLIASHLNRLEDLVPLSLTSKSWGCDTTQAHLWKKLCCQARLPILIPLQSNLKTSYRTLFVKALQAQNCFALVASAMHFSKSSRILSEKNIRKAWNDLEKGFFQYADFAQLIVDHLPQKVLLKNLGKASKHELVSQLKVENFTNKEILGSFSTHKFEKILSKDQLLSFLIQKQIKNNSFHNQSLNGLSRQELLKTFSFSEMAEILSTIRFSANELIKIKIIANFLNNAMNTLFPSLYQGTKKCGLLIVACNNFKDWFGELRDKDLINAIIPSEKLESPLEGRPTNGTFICQNITQCKTLRAATRLLEIYNEFVKHSLLGIRKNRSSAIRQLDDIAQNFSIKLWVRSKATEWKNDLEKQILG